MLLRNSSLVYLLPELSQKWRLIVGAGDATPALVDGKLYVFTRKDANEVMLCLDAGSGKELWQDRCAAQSVSGPARSHPVIAGNKIYVKDQETLTMFTIE